MQSGRIFLVALALSAFVAAPARADTLNDLFLVIENPEGTGGTPSISTTVGDGEFHEYEFIPLSHTIVNFATFLGGTYPFPLAQDTHGTDAATLFAATGFTPPDFNGQPFFLIGTVDVAGGEDTHLVLSNSLDAPPPGFFPDDLESVVIGNLANLDELLSGVLAADGGVASLFGVEGDGLDTLVSELVSGFEGTTPNPFGTLFGFIGGATSSFSTTGDGISNIFGFTDPVLLGQQTIGPGGVGNPQQRNQFDPVRSDPIPEPGTLALCSLVAAGFVWRRRRKSA